MAGWPLPAYLTPGVNGEDHNLKNGCKIEKQLKFIIFCFIIYILRKWKMTHCQEDRYAMDFSRWNATWVLSCQKMPMGQSVNSIV